jgi:2-C-methyl-D-erythritol 4-phosphate cytidylyltransferase
VDVAGIVLAADRGHRSGADTPTALWPLGAVPLLARAVTELGRSGVIDQLLVVAPPGCADRFTDVLASFPGPEPVVVEGGPGRHLSLHRGLAMLDSRIQTVVVHDACRPLAPAALAVRVVAAILAGADVAVPVVTVTDTVKEFDEAGRLRRTVPRESLARVQTPQAARRVVLEAAHVACDERDLAGDGAVLPVAHRGRLVFVDGDEDAFPIADPADLAYAEAALARG